MNDQPIPHKTIDALVIAFFILIFVGIVGYCAYAQKAGPFKEISTTANANASLDQKIADAQGGAVALSAEEYSLLLDRPLVKPDILDIKTKNDNVTIAFDDGHVNVAFPYLPNIDTGNHVFAYIDSIRNQYGEEIFDATSSLEKENATSTSMMLEKRMTSDGVAYWYGTREVHFIPGADITRLTLVSGKIVLKLPVANAAEAMTVEYPFIITNAAILEGPRPTATSTATTTKKN